MTRSLLLSLLAGSVAAQYFTLPIIDNNEIKLLDPGDPGYKVCASANQYLNSCISKAGGEQALSTANPASLAACACCVGTSTNAPAFSTCSSYLSAEAPLQSTQISAFGYLYSVCDSVPTICAGNTAGSGSAPKTTSIPKSTNVAPSSTVNPAVITSSPASVSVIQACSSMVGMFTSCTYNTPGFVKMPYKEQASCYCCNTSNGRVTFTDQLDQYAATCRDWAITGEPLTVYTVAKTFASFCEKFSDACDPSATIMSVPTDTSAGTVTDGGSTPTGQTTAAPTRTETPSGAVSNLRVGSAAGLVAIAAFVALL
ncbi:hypothetical protein PT974_09420 [Cladobotryum mycophilum]|uniref:Uncharacterized protein n=1 Tax=Cladobotryum mycophilum TaxID=491253 RepID=A0ABR0SH34_9HYPO